jgi:two-component system, NarL family, nitrate/nitrite sensor histidine kinase NarX
MLQRFAARHEVDAAKSALSNAATPAMSNVATPALSNAAAEAKDVYAPIERMMHVLVQRSGASAATLRMLDASARTLHLVAADLIPAPFTMHCAEVPADCGVCGAAIIQEALCSSSEACACVRELASDAEPARRVVTYPLSFRDRSCGVLALFVPYDGALPDDVVDLLPALGEVLGLALENARLLQAELHAAVMEERQLLASEVHDSLAQSLTSVRMRTSLLEGAIASHELDRASGYVAEIDETVAVAQSRVREIITHFRTGIDAQRLLSALGRTIDELRGLGGAAIEFHPPRREPALSPFERVQVFHIAREALTNAVRHAQARRVRMALSVRRGHCEVQVVDDGIGVDPTRPSDHGHFGINIMRERARRLGGRLEFEALSDGGTRVRLVFPIRGIGRSA